MDRHPILPSQRPSGRLRSICGALLTLAMVVALTVGRQAPAVADEDLFTLGQALAPKGEPVVVQINGCRDPKLSAGIIVDVRVDEVTVQTLEVPAGTTSIRIEQPPQQAYLLYGFCLSYDRESFLGETMQVGYFSSYGVGVPEAITVCAGGELRATAEGLLPATDYGAWFQDPVGSWSRSEWPRYGEIAVGEDGRITISGSVAGLPPGTYTLRTMSNEQETFSERTWTVTVLGDCGTPTAPTATPTATSPSPPGLPSTGS